VNDDSWSRWLMRSARTWADLSDAIGETGIDAIDRDHRRMGEYLLEINRLAEESGERGLGVSLIARQEALLRDLLACTEGHFAREEALISEWGIPDLEAQREQHDRILRSLRSAIEDFAAGKLTVTRTLKASILEWVVGHINGSDRATFAMKNWRGKLASATRWEELSGLVTRTGIDDIDDQHRAIIVKVLELAAALHDGVPAPERARSLFSEVEIGARSHFQYEEKFMLRHGIGGAEEQRAAHASFIGSLASHKERLERAEPGLSSELKVVLLEWWLGHVNEMDHRDFSARNWTRLALDRASAWRDVSDFVRKTGIDTIDADHRELVERCFRLAQVLDRRGKRGGSVEDFLAAFDSVLDFASSHFEREEELMQRLGKTEFFEEHRAEHERLVSGFAAMRADIAEARLPPSASIKLRLMDLLVDHTNGTDARSLL
jgi:hemerythrin-like metal-binding protein